MRRDRVALQTPLGDAAAVVRAVRRVGRVVYMSVGGRGRYKSWSAIKTGWSLWSTSVSIHAHSARATCHLLEERSVVAGARSPGYIRNRNRDGNGDHVRDWLLPPFLAASSRFINKGRPVLKLHVLYHGPSSPFRFLPSSHSPVPFLAFFFSVACVALHRHRRTCAPLGVKPAAQPELARTHARTYTHTHTRTHIHTHTPWSGRPDARDG